LDSYISQYILPYDSSEETAFLSQFINCQKKVASPSVSFQVSHFEVTVDPYLQSLQRNYYFPISLDLNMGTEDIGSSPSSQPVHLNSKATQSLPKTITVEDSVDVISDLIREIQATDTKMEMEESSPAHKAPHIIHPSKVSNSSLRFSLLQKSFLTSQSSSNITQLKQFFHCLSGIPSTTILPIRLDNPVSLLKTTSQINELSFVGMRSFFKANHASSHSTAGDYHIKSSLSFGNLLQHPHLSNWLILNGYLMVLCASVRKRIWSRLFFFSRVCSFAWEEDQREFIKQTEEWKENPFPFKLYHGTLSLNKKGMMAPVLMVEVARPQL